MVLDFQTAESLHSFVSGLMLDLLSAIAMAIYGLFVVHFDALDLYMDVLTCESVGGWGRRRRRWWMSITYITDAVTAAAQSVSQCHSLPVRLRRIRSL